jgi:hypothetical protein
MPSLGQTVARHGLRIFGKEGQAHDNLLTCETAKGMHLHVARTFCSPGCGGTGCTCVAQDDRLTTLLESAARHRVKVP